MTLLLPAAPAETKVDREPDEDGKKMDEAA